MAGLIGAIELVADKDSMRRFDKEAGAGSVCRDMSIESGLVMRPVSDTMVLSPPLTLSHEQADELVEKAWRALDLTQKTLSG
jgi:putrescine aminotransferase